MSRGLVNAIGVLVVDVVLLLTMLVGLLRYAHGSSTGMWKLLYQQVTLERFFLAPEAQFILVYCLVSVGLFSRDTACGRSLLPPLDVILLTISQVFLSLNWNCVSFVFPLLCVDGG